LFRRSRRGAEEGRRSFEKFVAICPIHDPYMISAITTANPAKTHDCVSD